MHSSGMGGGHHVFLRKKRGAGNPAADTDLINSVCPNVRGTKFVARASGTM